MANLNEFDGSWKHYAKVCIRYLAMIFGAFFIYFAVSYLLNTYQAFRLEQKTESRAAALKDFEKKQYDLAMNDTYGGKTPQETLQMYIEAVESGDYDLASKYFVVDNQLKELESLHNSDQAKINKIVLLLKQDLTTQGSYSLDKNGFTIRKPILVDFKKYPNGIWKIIEI